MYKIGPVPETRHTMSNVLVHHLDLSVLVSRIPYIKTHPHFTELKIPSSKTTMQELERCKRDAF